MSITDFVKFLKTWKKTNKPEIIKVEFKKSDGTLRKMVCIPSDPNYKPKTQQTTDKKRKNNPDVISVYDIEKKAWRSVNLKRVLKVEKVEKKD